MAWTEPKTWAAADPLTATILNTHLRDNLNALKAPPTAHAELNQGSDYTTTSTSFVDVDATNLALAITTTGGDVLVHFHGTINNASYRVYFDIAVDGTRIGGDDGIISGMGTDVPVSFSRLITGLAAGSHTFKLQWKVQNTTGKLYAGAGATADDTHPQFWAREV